MKFEGDHFDGTWNNGLCDNHAQGDRALDRAAEVALASARRPHQDHYGELIRRADAGDRTVDYTALRSESIYAPGWDFYSGEVGSLLDQANALVKGKDCPAAMEKLDQAIRLDFTADAAHALRSDCLKAAGQAAGAKIESDIADGLVHSLMDSGSGGGRGLISALSDNNGSSEQNAYVAFTQREEMDVLANRHIQVRVRQTEIRGANGRYYDLIKGVSVRNGGALDATLKSVYFDITGYVVGRVSRRAAAEAALASVH
jgi:hypothetical protein